MIKTPRTRIVRIATAGWSIPREHSAAFPGEGSGLARYAAVLPAVEINSTFYRRHRVSTFERWRETVPASFRFSLKLSRAITHDAELASPKAALTEFFSDAAALGPKLGVVLVQLAGSHAFAARRATTFFRTLRSIYDGPIAFEPRHASWYDPKVDALLAEAAVSRVLADPPRPKPAAEAGGSKALLYIRLHGSPRTYYSAYGEERLPAIAARIRASTAKNVWCVFDNTASGAAAGDALLLASMLTA